MNDKAILTGALTGVLTDPKQHPVPVTPAQMAGMMAEEKQRWTTLIRDAGIKAE